MSTSAIGNFLKRNEVTTVVVALVVTALGLLAPRAGIALPVEAVTTAITAAWAVVVGAIFEGAYKPNYSSGIAVLKGQKMRMALIAVLAQLGVSGLTAVGISIPEDAVTLLSEFLVMAILGKGVVDALTASRKP